MKAFIDACLFIYLNTITEENIRRIYESLYMDVLLRYKAYTNVLVIDELLYISKKKYKIPYKITINFIKKIVEPYVTILPVTEEDLKQAYKILLKHNLKPSNAIHIATMKNNNIKIVVTEDREYDKIPEIKRIWT